MKAKEIASNFIGEHPEPSKSDDFLLAVKKVADDLTMEMSDSFHGWKTAIEKFRSFAVRVNKHYGTSIIDPMGIKNHIFDAIKESGAVVPKMVLDKLEAIR